MLPYVCKKIFCFTTNNAPYYFLLSHWIREFRLLILYSGDTQKDHAGVAFCFSTFDYYNWSLIFRHSSTSSNKKTLLKRNRYQPLARPKMMLMTKFGKFKLRLIATINMSVLLSVFNIASTTSNYWVKYVDKWTKTVHYVGMLRSCQDAGDCVWRNGIFSNTHSFWSLFVRLFMAAGTIANIGVVVLFLTAFICKCNKRSRRAIHLMEWANLTLVTSFVCILVAFCVFISSTCSFSAWLHVLSMILLIVASNLITRTFATLYFRSTRAKSSKSVGVKLDEECEEKIALAAVSNKDAVTNTECTNGDIATVEKISETHGSNEALLPQAVAVVEAVNTPAIAAMEVTSTPVTAEVVQPTA